MALSRIWSAFVIIAILVATIKYAFQPGQQKMQQWLTVPLHVQTSGLWTCATWRLAFLLCQDLASSGLVVLDDFLGDPLHDRV